MKSRGEKREYLCPDCRSPDIEHVTYHGQSSYSCNNCDTVGPWCERLKVKAEEDSNVQQQITA